MKFVNKLALFLLMVGGQSLNAAEKPWCHSHLTSAENVKIDFDYQLLSDSPSRSGASYTVTASPAWFNVSGDSLQGSEHVRVVALVYRYATPHGSVNYPSPPMKKEVDLTWSPEDRKFSGQIPYGLLLYSYTQGSNNAAATYFEFATVIDGRWLKDPVSGRSNFKVFPFKSNTGKLTCQDR